MSLDIYQAAVEGQVSTALHSRAAVLVAEMVLALFGTLIHVLFFSSIII